MERKDPPTDEMGKRSSPTMQQMKHDLSDSSCENPEAAQMREGGGKRECQTSELQDHNDGGGEKGWVY